MELDRIASDIDLANDLARCDIDDGQQRAFIAFTATGINMPKFATEKSRDGWPRQLAGPDPES